MLKRNIIANYLGQGWSAIMGLAFVPLYIQYLGMEAYGLIGLFAVMQAWLSLLDMGMTPTLNREMARFSAGEHSPQSIHDLLRSLEIICACLALIIALSVWVASDYLASDWLKADKLPSTVVAQAISVMALVVALRFIEGIYRGSLFGLQRQVWYNGVNAVIATLRNGGAVIVLASISPSIKAFFYWQAVVSLLSIGIFAMGVHRVLPRPPSRPRFSRLAIADIWKFASGMMAVTFLAILLTQVDKMLLSRLLPLESFGYYTLATSVAGMLYMIIGPVTTAFYPRFVELSIQENQVALINAYHQGAQLITLLISPAVILLSFFPEDIMYMWSGNVNLAANVAPILSIFVLGVFLNGLMQMPAQLQLAYGWVGLGIKTNIVAVTVLIPALFWVVPQYGVIGAAWIWVILNAGYVLIALQFMHRKLLAHEKWRWYFADVFFPSIGSIGVMLVVKQFHPESYQNRWDAFYFLLLVGMLALLASTILANQIRPRLLAFINHKLRGL